MVAFPRHVWALSVVWLAGCGSGVTFGIAPGPVDEAPLPSDAGPGPVVPPPDSGPPPPVDAGPGCEEVLLPAPSAEESRAEFDARGLGAAFACAACHRGRSPEGVGIGWGAASDDADGWYAAATSLADRDAANGVQVEDSSLYRHFNGSDGTHPVNVGARDNTGAWLRFLWEPRSELVCEEPDAGPGEEPCFTPYPEADSRAYFSANLESGFISCSACHRGAPSGANGNVQFDATTAWQVAYDRLESNATSAAGTTIGQVLRVDGATLPGHGYAFGAADAAKVWIESHLFGVPTGAPGCE